MIDYYIAVNETRISVEHQQYNKLKKPIIIPKVKLKEIKEDFDKVKFIDYGVTIKTDTFSYYNNYAVLPYNLSSVCCHVALIEKVYINYRRF